MNTLDRAATFPALAARLADLGYWPVPIPAGSKGPNRPGWPELRLTAETAPAAFAGAALVGILHVNVAVLDIDVTDPALAAEIAAEVRRRWPDALERIGAAPKTSFWFRLEGDPWTCRNTRKRERTTADGEVFAAQVEVRAGTGQAVAYGIHPGTGKPYTWPRGELWATPRDALPLLTREAAEDYRDWCDARIAEWAGEAPTPALRIDNGASFDFARDGAGRGEVEEILSWIDPDIPYNVWLGVLMALHGHFGGSAEGLAVADAWSAKGAKYQAGDVASRWAGQKPQIGDKGALAAACALARQAGADLNGIARRHRGRPADDLARDFGDANMDRPFAPPDAYAEARDMSCHVPEPPQPRFFCPAVWQGMSVPPRQSLVPEMVPSQTVTLLSGDGGTGKSLLALQLAYAVATGGAWLGRSVASGGAMFISAEDDEAELHRRLADVVRASGGSFDDLDRLTLASLAGQDALLSTLDKSGRLLPSALFHEIEKRIAEESPALVVLDTLADLFPGNENDRAQARQFIGLLRGLAIHHECAILLLAHPSLSGLNSGTGTSGSTGWNNSVRSRLYMSRITDNGFEPDPDARVLSIKKANYGRTGGEINLKWEAGVFVADAQPTGLDALAARAKGERVFLNLLDTLTAQGRYVSASPGPTYAPTQFASHPEAEGCTKRALKSAMDALFGRGEIVIATHGSGAKARSHIARKGGDHGQE